MVAPGFKESQLAVSLPVARNAGGIQTELLGTIRVLLLYDLHLFFVHTSAMHLELGQSTGDLFHVFSSQYKFGGFDVLLQVLDLARSGDRNDERLLGQEPCERQLRRRSVFSLRKFGDAIDKGFIRSYAFRPETVKSRTQIRFRIKLRLCIKLMRQIAHANGAPGHKADSQFFAGIEQAILFRVTVHERILCLEGCDGLYGMCFAYGVGASFREAEMQHLADLDKLFHGTRNVFDWNTRIDPMLIEEIDAVRTETLQAPVHHSLYVMGPAVQTALVGEVEAELRCDLHLITERFECSADDRLTCVRAVHFCHIEECNALDVGLADDLDGIVDRRCRAVI